MIPKVIHYCWFGGKELTEMAKKCILSWKKYCPDYEIKEWNESNFDPNICNYTKEAYQNGKWAFVSDYARFKILYDNGGIYFDTDVEIIASIDGIIQRGGFMGMEGKKCKVASGLGMAAQKGNLFLKAMLDDYEKRHFEVAPGILDQTSVVEIETQLLQKKGYKLVPEEQTIDGIVIYPSDYFAPIDYGTGKMVITKNTRTIHHYSESWKTKKEVSWHNFQKIITNQIGQGYSQKIFECPVVRLVGSIYRNGITRTIRMYTIRYKN